MFLIQLHLAKVPTVIEKKLILTQVQKIIPQISFNTTGSSLPTHVFLTTLAAKYGMGSSNNKGWQIFEVLTRKNIGCFKNIGLCHVNILLA